MRDIFLWLLAIFVISFFIVPYDTGDEFFLYLQAEKDIADRGYVISDYNPDDVWVYDRPGIVGIIGWDFKTWVEKQIESGIGLSKFYISKENDVWLVKSWNDKPVMSFYSQGRPFAYDKNSQYVFFIDDSGRFIKRYNIETGSVSSFVYPSFVTSFSAPYDYIAVSVLGGEIFIDSPDRAQRIISLSAEHPSVVYAVNISSDGKYLAAVDGVKNQTLHLFSLENEIKKLWTTSLDGVLRRPVYLKISNHRVIAEEQNGILIKDIESAREKRVRVKGLFKSYFVKDLGIDLFFSKNDSRMAMSIISDGKELFTLKLADLYIAPGYNKNRLLFLTPDGAFLLKLKVSGDDEA